MTNKRNKKTWAERILNAASKEETITTAVLRKRFRIPTTVISNVDFNNTIMRTARLLASPTTKQLKRVSPGEYRITKKGVKALVNA